MKSLLALVALVSFAGQSSHASDHIDGPVTQKHRVADLSDFYAFPTPGKAGSLSLILNTYPIAPKKAHFTDKATYSFLIRKASIKGTSQESAFQTSNEVVINCKFVTPHSHEKHTVTCKSTNGLVANAKYNFKNSDQGDFRLYSGMQSDPFFFWSDFAAAAANEGVLKAPKNSNTMSRINCLSIAIEIDLEKLFPGNSAGLVAAATAVVTRDSQTAPLRILDRIGRPEVTNVSMFTPKGEPEVRDLFNAERPFEVSANAQAVFEARLNKNIRHYDNIDKKANWTDENRSAFVKLFADDFLVVDPSKPCNTDAFLEIEKSMLLGQAHKTCGGRKPVDDIMDTLFTVYIAGLNGTRIRDGVDAPNKAISNNFPHLAAPDLDFISLSKAAIARKVLGLED